MMKEMLKKWVKKLPIAFTKNQKYDQLTNRIIKHICTPDSNCVDVGCHKGEVLRTILKHAPNGQHYCFEPIPEMYEQLAQNFPDNCHFFQLGLSNEAGTTTFNHVVSNPAYSGFEQREYARPNEKIIEIEVQKERLDAIIPKDLNIDLIKIDVEGAELQVLQGAERTIRRSKPVIIFEHGKGAADYYDTSPSEVYDLLQNYGMKIMLLDEFFKTQQALSKTQLIEQFEQRLNYYFVANAL